jgi:Skp family chaperone for outer membrane proteins
MSTSGHSRKFQFGPGWLLFLGMIALLLFNKNSRDVLKTLKERVNGQTQRMRTEVDGLKAALEKKRQEEK